MKLSMSISSSKSTVRMYLISDPLGVSYVSPSGNSAFQRLSESKPLKRVHSTIELPVTTTHCERSVDTLWVEYAAKLLAFGLLRFQQGLLGPSRKEALK